MANGTIIIEAKNKSSAMKSLKQAPKSALKALLWWVPLRVHVCCGDVALPGAKLSRCTGSASSDHMFIRTHCVVLRFSANPLPENSWQVAAPWVPPPMGPWTTNGSPSRYD